MNYKKIFILYIFYIISFFNISYTLKCGKEDIENCLECGSGDKANECIICKDKHFLFFNNLYCLPCNDSFYGQIGCEGNCDATNYLEKRNVFCDKDGCKEGFYNLEGFCFNCSEGTQGCKKCSYTLNQKNEHEYHCTECLNNEYKLNSQGHCDHCNIDNCKKCHYDLYGNNLWFCDQCYEGYYLDSSKRLCKRCKGPIEINNGNCTICSDIEEDYESGSCWCNLFYTIKNHSTCVKCPDNCPYCKYNNKTNKIECLKCEPGYTLNPEKECTKCGNGCEYCTLSDDLTPICTTCFSRKFTSKNKCLICPENCKYCDNNEKCTYCKHGYILLNNGECGKCPLGCNKCGLKENNDIICLNCDEHYALKSEKECVYCPNITGEGLLGCSKCRYNQEKQNFECYECQKKYTKNYWINIYTYVTNTFQCFSNTNKSQPLFYGGSVAYKNGSRYECQKCTTDSSIIMIKNKKICKNWDEINLYNCYEVEDIGEIYPIYSCTKCKYNYAKIYDGEITKCLFRSGRLSFCLEGIYNSSNHQYNCTKCVPNADLNSSYLCQPDSDSFCRDNWCYKCDNEAKGNIGCIAEKGCTYYITNNQLNCKECKEGFFSYAEGQCYSCSVEILKCEKCHYNNTINELICDKCPNGYTFNSKDKKCELKNCEYYPEIYEGCVICDKNREEYILKKNVISVK